MKFKLPVGECCSCGRTVPMRAARVCPYCSEAVLWPLKWRMAGWFLLYMPFAFTAMGLMGKNLSLHVYPDSPTGRLLFWGACVLALLPVSTRGIVVSSRRDIVSWSAWSLLGQLYASFLFWWNAASFEAAPFPAALSALSLCLLPVFWWISWRIVAIGMMFFIALAM